MNRRELLRAIGCGFGTLGAANALTRTRWLGFNLRDLGGLGNSTCAITTSGYTVTP